MSFTAAGGTPATYDRIGTGHHDVRRPDPRPAELIHLPRIRELECLDPVGRQASPDHGYRLIVAGHEGPGAA